MLTANLEKLVRISLITGLLCLWESADNGLNADEGKAVKRIAAVVTEYRQNSHADVIVSRLFQTDTLDGTGARPNMQLMSVFTDQVPTNDTSRKWAAKYGFRISPTVADALTMGTNDLTVDGVLLVAEHGTYPRSDTGQTQYPKRRLFTEIVDVFRKTKKRVPVFIDKHLADTWQDAKFIYDTAQELQIPLMAGSSVPSAWRDPEIDVRRGAKLKQFVGFSYASLDAYGFHGLEMLQAFVERRDGGETGIRSVQCLVGAAVWDAGQRGEYDEILFKSCRARLTKGPSPEKSLREVVPEPVLFIVDYSDGLRACLFTLNDAVSEWTAAWRYDDDTIESTNCRLQDTRPFMHFTWLVDGVDQMMQTGRPTWKVERTLLTSGALDALLISKRDQGRPVETPYLSVTYENEWNWKQPPPPPSDRRLDQQ